MDVLLKTQRIKAFFVNSLFHSPTGSSLSAFNAFRILQLANEHDILLVEDDVYGDFATDAHGRLVALDDLQKVVYVSSFSKTLSANLRVGYVVAPASVISTLADLKLLTSVTVPAFCERFLNAIQDEGMYQRHLRTLQQRLKTHQAIAQEAFQRWGWEIYHRASGGMFLQVRHRDVIDTDALIERGRTEHILLLPGKLFTADGRASSWLRINVSHLDVEKATGLFGTVSP